MKLLTVTFILLSRSMHGGFFFRVTSNSTRSLKLCRLFKSIKPTTVFFLGLIRHTLKHLVSGFALSLLMYFLLWSFSAATEDRCTGWDCEYIYCPDEYSMKVPDGSYVKCEELDTYLESKEL